MEEKKEIPGQPGTAPKSPADWLKQKQLRQKKTPVFQKGPISKVQFHGSRHRG